MSVRSPSSLLKARVKKTLNQKIAAIEKRLRSNIRKIGRAEDSEGALRRALEKELAQACHEAAREVIILFSASHGATKDPLREDELKGTKRQARLFISRAIRRLNKPMTAQLQARSFRKLDTNELEAKIRHMVEEEVGMFDTRTKQGLDIGRKEKAEIIASNTSDLKILFLAANPWSTDRLQLDEEARLIQERIRKGSHRDAIRFETRWAVRLDDILDYMNEIRPKIVHLSGHGQAGTSGGIQIVASGGGGRVLGSNELLSLFTSFATDIQLVVLNCCYSETQAAAISRVIDFTVGMSAAIGDNAARDFSGQFYSALAYGRPVGDAFDQAKVKLLLDHKLESQKPRLLVRAGVQNKAGRLLKAPEEVDYRSFGNLLNSLSHNYFSKRSSVISSILTAADSLTKSNASMTQVSSAIRRIVSSMEGEIAAASKFSESLVDATTRRRQSLNEIALERAQAIYDLFAQRRGEEEPVLELLRKQVPAFTASAVLENLRLEKSATPFVQILGGVSELVKSYCRGQVVFVQSLSVAYSKYIEYLPSVLKRQIKARKWRYTPSSGSRDA